MLGAGDTKVSQSGRGLCPRGALVQRDADISEVITLHVHC